MLLLSQPLSGQGVILLQVHVCGHTPLADSGAAELQTSDAPAGVLTVGVDTAAAGVL